MREMMKHLTVGIFHNEHLGSELGKKGTKSDIEMFNKKTDTQIFTFMSPVDNKLSAKTQIMSSIDFAIIYYKEPTIEFGETILLLNDYEITKGLIVTDSYVDREKLHQITAETIVSSYDIIEMDKIKINEYLSNIEKQQNIDSPCVVEIDHSFSVKGVGEVILGVVKKGILKKHAKLVLMPKGKEVVIRSIQMQDKDFDSAEAGSRVGLAIKGATSEEMKRGCLLCEKEAVIVSKEITLDFQKNKFSNEIKPGIFHMSTGMQTIPIEIKHIEDEKISVVLEKDIVYMEDSIFVLLDLNAAKLHLMGKGTLSS